MTILGLGLDRSGNPLFPPTDEEAFVTSVVNALGRNVTSVAAIAATTSQAVAFRGEIERVSIDPGDPRKAGWTFLVNASDPRREEYVQTLGPLAAHRGMTDPHSPLLYNGEGPDEWLNWLNDNYFSRRLEGAEVPQYILIVGTPKHVPFLFQSVLDTVANVGRVDFDDMDDFGQYVAKLIRLETAEDPSVAKEVLVFAPDAGLPDPTYFSREYMALPLVGHIRNELGFKARTLFGPDATKKNLRRAFDSGAPALVYTASHGLGALGEPLVVQKQYNGAICCQKTGQEKRQEDRLFMADDVPLDKPFLEGAVFFQFACFGYGTPAQSDYSHWLDGFPERYADEDFVAALPKRLLAHPRGPIAYVGHLDTAFLHGFANVEDLNIPERWHKRIAPFVQAVDYLLGVQPSGLAMNDMNTRYSAYSTILANTYDRQQRGTLQWSPDVKARFLDSWITRNDAQNYMIFGDPAARLRIPAE